MFTRRKLPIGILLAGLLTLVMSVGVYAQEPPTEDLGGDATARDGSALSDSLSIALSDVPAAPAGMVYEGWLISASGSKISVGTFSPDGSGDVTQTYDGDGSNLLASYSTFAISVEPAVDPDPATPGAIYWADTIPAGAFTHIGHLSVAWGPNPDSKGIVVGLREQAGVANAHALLAQSSTTLASKQSHAHHVINIIEGTGGANYDASFGDPGDGVGVLNYAADTIKHADFAKGEAPDDATVAAGADAVIAATNDVIARAELARDGALLVANASSDNLIVDVGLANAVGLSGEALTAAGTAYTSAQDMGAFVPVAGGVTTPVTGDSLVPVVALVALIAGALLATGGGLLVFRRRLTA